MAPDQFDLPRNKRDVVVMTAWEWHCALADLFAVFVSITSVFVRDDNFTRLSFVLPPLAFVLVITESTPCPRWPFHVRKKRGTALYGCDGCFIIFTSFWQPIFLLAQTGGNSLNPGELWGVGLQKVANWASATRFSPGFSLLTSGGAVDFSAGCLFVWHGVLNWDIPCQLWWPALGWWKWYVTPPWKVNTICCQFLFLYKVCWLPEYSTVSLLSKQIIVHHCQLFSSRSPHGLVTSRDANRSRK